MNWRFIPYATYDAATNMAVDEYLLETHLAGKLPPVLRLYGFAPPAVTLGRNQDLDPAAFERILAKGFQVASRPTGGRAVLHYKDITYSFVGSEIGTSEFGVLKPSVIGAYKQICAGLQEAFAQFDLNAVLGESGSAYRNLSDCFLATTPADLQVNGLKLAGSAQLRRRTAVLQHGSIPLSLEQSLMPELLGEKISDQALARHANLFELAGREISFAELEAAFKTGFEKAFSVSFDTISLDSSELEQAGTLKLPV
ncbi:MAG: lipoate--protein ligase family protein [Candidatus Obscuribacterales bacterium]|nr:lipoate--protein ligase family protein [Candidatus Obscuribacterales bacterium]